MVLFHQIEAKQIKNVELGAEDNPFPRAAKPPVPQQPHPRQHQKTPVPAHKNDKANQEKELRDKAEDVPNYRKEKIVPKPEKAADKAEAALTPSPQASPSPVERSSTVETPLMKAITALGHVATPIVKVTSNSFAMLSENAFSCLYFCSFITQFLMFLTTCYVFCFVAIASFC
jgi:hypothetical protein